MQTLDEADILDVNLPSREHSARRAIYRPIVIAMAGFALGWIAYAGLIHQELVRLNAYPFPC